MIYPLEGPESEKEYVGSGYLDDDIKLTIYRQDDLFIGYVGNNETSSYPANSFTVMEAMHLTIAGCYYVENINNIREDILDRLEDIHLTKVDIPEDSQWKYRLGGEFYDL